MLFILVKVTTFGFCLTFDASTFYSALCKYPNSFIQLFRMNVWRIMVESLCIYKMQVPKVRVLKVALQIIVNSMGEENTTKLIFEYLK